MHVSALTPLKRVFIRLYRLRSELQTLEINTRNTEHHQNVQHLLSDLNEIIKDDR